MNDRQLNLNKLIRLTTNDRNAIFDAEFDEEVLIPPQTEVALKSASIALTGASEVVAAEGLNPIIQISHNNTNHAITVKAGKYNVNNIDEFFDDITAKLNGSMRLGQDINETGLEYLVGINQAQRCEIQCIYSRYLSPTGLSIYEIYANETAPKFWKTNGGRLIAESVEGLNDGTATRLATAGLTTVPDYRGTVFADFSFSGGAGVWRSVIEQLRPPLGAGHITGFQIGFTSNRNALINGTMTDDDVLLGLRVQATNAGGVGNFEFKASSTTGYVDTGVTPGTVTVPGAVPPVAPELRPCIEWQSTEDQATRQHMLKCILHRDGVAAVNLGQVLRQGELASNKELIGFYAFYAGETFNDITAVNYCPSFFNTTADEETMRIVRGVSDTHSGTSGLGDSNLPGIIGSRGDFPAPVRFRMIIPNPVIKSRIMGFDPSKYTGVNGQTLPTTTVYDITDIDLLFPSGETPVAHLRDRIPYINLNGAAEGVIAPATSFSIFGSQNYLVELLNLPLNSYDSFPSKRGRANILAVIPENEHESGNVENVLMYEPNEMTYISLTNKSELSLRNIRARIIFPDYTPIETIGLTTVVLHLRPVK
jgi:hypothetical protein